MIPMMAVLRVERGQRRRVRLWLPLFLLWLLALPVLVVALPVVAIILLAYSRNPLRIFAAYWSVLSAIPGSHIEVSGRRGHHVTMHVY
jgi:hypothetical protein